jgi:hypothetical protein
MIESILTALQQSQLALAVAHSNHLFAAGLQIVHVVGLILLTASVVLINIRAQGQGLAAYEAGPIVRETARLLWLGLALVAASGALIFAASAVRYANNSAFECKIVLLLAAVWLQWQADRRLVPVGAGAPAPQSARWLAAGAALAWVGVAGAGRAIGYI